MRITSVKINSAISPQINFDFTPSDSGENFHRNRSNFYSYLIGPNGSYKSLILSEIASALITSKSNNSQVFLDSPLAKVICISTGLNDRFPKIFLKPEEQLLLLRKSTYSSKFSDRNYLYFGPSTGKHTISSKVMMKRLFLNLLSSKDKKKVFNGIKKTLSLNGFESKISIRFQFSRAFIKFYLNTPGRGLQKYVRSLLEFSKYRTFAKNLDLDNEAIETISRILDQTTSDNSITKSISHTIDLSVDKSSMTFFTEVLPTLLLLEHTKAVTIQEFAFKRKKDETNSTPSFVNILDMSSGEFKRLFIFLSLACSLENDSVVLIDEPEISTHPEWQIKFSNDLGTYFNDVTGCHCIIATHSPHLISGTPQEESSILAIKKNSGSVSIDEYRPPFGASVEQVLMDIFGLATSRNYFFEERLREVLFAIENKEEILTSGKIDQLNVHINSLTKYISSDEDPLHLVLSTAKREFGFK